MDKPNLSHPSNGKDPSDIDFSDQHRAVTESDESNLKAVKAEPFNTEDNERGDNAPMELSVLSDKDSNDLRILATNPVDSKSYQSATDITPSNSVITKSTENNLTESKNLSENGTSSLHSFKKRNFVARHERSFRNSAKGKRRQKRKFKKPLKIKIIQSNLTIINIKCRIFFRKKRTLKKFRLSLFGSTLSNVLVYPCFPVLNRTICCSRCRRMDSRVNRIQSFQRANCPVDIDINLLANSGFYYCIHHKKCLCYACGVNCHDLNRIPAHDPQCTHSLHHSYSDERHHLQNGKWRLDEVQSQRFNANMTQDENHRNGTLLQGSRSSMERTFEDSGAIAAGNGTDMRPFDNQSTGFENAARSACSAFDRLTIDETQRRHQRNINDSSILYCRPRLEQNIGHQSAQEDEDVCVINRRLRPSTIVARTVWELRQENTRLRNQILCIICGIRKKKVVFLPCHHLVTCEQCSILVEDCPVYLCCRKIENRTTVHL